MMIWKCRASSGETIYVEAANDVDAREAARNRWARHGIRPVTIVVYMAPERTSENRVARVHDPDAAKAYEPPSVSESDYAITAEQAYAAPTGAKPSKVDYERELPRPTRNLDVLDAALERARESGRRGGESTAALRVASGINCGPLPKRPPGARP